jgi:predicted kinase
MKFLRSAQSYSKIELRSDDIRRELGMLPKNIRKEKEVEGTKMDATHIYLNNVT